MTKNESVDAEKKAVDEQKKNKKKKEDQEKENEGFRPFKKDEEEVVVDVKEKPKEGESISETEAVAGYGEPTKGAYDATEKGFKTFGTEGQGKDKEGLKGEKSDKKDCRQMRVSVTAVDDQATDTILLEIGAYDFIEEYEWVEEGSSKLALAFSSLVAASFFMI